MSSLGSVKYKMHRAVNYLFYAGIFGIGFLMGTGFKFINITDFIQNITKYFNIF